jgi:ketosteroid isomerase-like protein
VGTYLDLCHPDWELVTPVAELEGVLRGEAGVREFFSSLEQAATLFRLEVESLRSVAGHRVLALLRLNVVSEGGARFSEEAANVYELERGRLRRVHVYRDREEARRAFEAGG